MADVEALIRDLEMAYSYRIETLGTSEDQEAQETLEKARDAIRAALTRPAPSPNDADLIRRLRGEYRIPITDGLGAAGGEEPDNTNEFVRRFETPPIQHEAANRLEVLARMRGAAVPEGWKLVPVEPTETMIAAGDDRIVDALNDTGIFVNADRYSKESPARQCYASMLAAAPEVPR